MFSPVLLYCILLLMRGQFRNRKGESRERQWIVQYSDYERLHWMRHLHSIRDRQRAGEKTASFHVIPCESGFSREWARERERAGWERERDLLYVSVCCDVSRTHMLMLCSPLTRLTVGRPSLLLFLSLLPSSPLARCRVCIFVHVYQGWGGWGGHIYIWDNLIYLWSQNSIYA